MIDDERKKDALRKILACLALSKSANEHEAAAGLRQAQALMAKYGLEEVDVLAAGASERKAKSAAKNTPPSWENSLAQLINRAFGCRLIFLPGGWRASKGDWLFIGCGPAPEVASYAFDVLLRQAKAARAEYIKTALKRCTTANKTRRADLFCEGWVDGASQKVTPFSTDAKARDAIAAYVERRFPSLDTLSTRDRNDGASLRYWHYGDLAAGRRDGSAAQLRQGVGPGSQHTRLTHGVEEGR